MKDRDNIVPGNFPKHNTTQQDASEYKEGFFQKYILIPLRNSRPAELCYNFLDKLEEKRHYPNK